MAHQYAKIAFTDKVRQVQVELNSRAGYTSMDQGEDHNFMFSQNEVEFISQRDSFYMASVSETSWPYVQHRGGPRGFLKVLDAQTLGFADYKGNRQYVSTGNFRTNDKVSIILMDYPNKRRLKILGHISQIDEQDWETLASLEDSHYKARVERGFIIKISAFDWNCPQHITPRYTEAKLIELVTPLQEKIKLLELQNSAKELNTKKEPLGDGELPLVITGIRQLTPDIRAYELRRPDHKPLPVITAGSHIQVPISLANETLSWRNYSITSNPKRTDCYEIAVKLESNGKGGSLSIHQNYQLGMVLNCKLPENFFPLNEGNHPAILIAGGIGITAIKSMALALIQSNTPFELHYAGRNKNEMAYADRLIKQLGQNLFLYPSQENKKLSVKTLIKNSDEQCHFYLCGPQNMIQEFNARAQKENIDTNRIHYELFASSFTKAKDCQLTLSKSNISIEVNSEQTLLDAVLEAGIEMPYSCLSGECKTCVVNVDKNSEIDHFDNCLTEEERTEGKMCLCVSRPKSKKLVVAL